jgi:hypothetical protein
MFNFMKNALRSSTTVAAPVVEVPAKPKAPRKPKAPKAPTALEAARANREAGWSLSGMDKAQTEAFGPAFEAAIHDYLRKGAEAEQSGRAIGAKLNVMLGKAGDNAHWSATTDEKRKATNEAVRLRYVEKYIEVKTLQGNKATRSTARRSWANVVGYSLEAAGYKEASNERGQGNAKEYADFALQNATTAYKRGYRLPADKRDAKDTTAMELYGNIIAHYQGASGLKAVQKAVNDSVKTKAPAKVPAKGTVRKPRTTAKAAYPRKTTV